MFNFFAAKARFSIKRAFKMRRAFLLNVEKKHFFRICLKKCELGNRYYMHIVKLDYRFFCEVRRRFLRIESVPLYFFRKLPVVCTFWKSFTCFVYRNRVGSILLIVQSLEASGINSGHVVFFCRNSFDPGSCHFDQVFLCGSQFFWSNFVRITRIPVTRIHLYL